MDQEGYSHASGRCQQTRNKLATGDKGTMAANEDAQDSTGRPPPHTALRPPSAPLPHLPLLPLTSHPKQRPYLRRVWAVLLGFYFVLFGLCVWLHSRFFNLNSKFGTKRKSRSLLGLLAVRADIQAYLHSYVNGYSGKWISYYELCIFNQKIIYIG